MILTNLAENLNFSDNNPAHHLASCGKLSREPQKLPQHDKNRDCL